MRRRALRAAILGWFAGPIIAAGLIAVMVLAALGVTIAEANSQATAQCGVGVSTGPPPPSGTVTMGAMVKWFEVQGLSANAAAGVTGNGQQENGLSPVLNSGGLGIWQVTPGSGLLPSLYGYAAAHGLNVQSAAAQMGWLMTQLHGRYAGLLKQMNAASSPGQATLEFMTIFEVCDPRACNPSNRVKYADEALAAAGGSPVTTVQVSLQSQCSTMSSAGPGGYVNPFAHLQGSAPNRIDMGLDWDGHGPVGAIGQARITFAGTHVGGGWVCSTSDNGAVVYQLLDGLDKGRFVYVAEDVVPTVHVGELVAAGQPIATLHNCLEWAGQPRDRARIRRRRISARYPAVATLVAIEPIAVTRCPILSTRSERPRVLPEVSR